MFFFFFQAEDGIRDKLVTGVQTCALPISSGVVVGASAPTTHDFVLVPLGAVWGDFDADHKADITVFRPSTGAWHVLKSSTNNSSSQSFSWGLSTDTPVPADYDGDRTIDPAVYRPST